MHSLALYVTGNDVHGRMVRRTLMRYLNLSLILVLRSISSAVKRRFPTMDHLVEAGFMTSQELEMFQAVPNLEFNTYWIPCTWFIALLKDTRTANRVTDSQGLQTIVQEFNEFRSKCGMLWSYDWISIPLVYTQVVTLATYSFFLAALVGRQYIDERKSEGVQKQFQMEVDIYLPLFTILQFFFYMGLLKVAEQLINPFGDDDEDFELNWLIDRHTKVSYLGVDTLMARYPPLVKDKYFDEMNIVLPYTGAAFAYKKKTYRGSVHNMQVPEDQQSMFLPEISEEDEDDHESCTRGNTPKKTSSFTNLMNAVSPSAGIWRPSNEGTGSVYSGNLETSNHQAELKINAGLGKFETKAPWKSQNLSIKSPVPPPPLFSDLYQWSSQSTLDSVDSTQFSVSPGQTKNPFDMSFQQHNETCSTVPIVRKTDSLDTVMYKSASRSSIHTETEKTGKRIFKYRSTGNIALSLKNSFSKHLKDFKGSDRTRVRTMFDRRQSSSSGQWKGVRWKPVIDDTGDMWSDNATRRPSNDLCQKCKQPSSAPVYTYSPSVCPPSHSSSESVTSSFHSLNDVDPAKEMHSLPSNKSQHLKSKSLANVSGHFNITSIPIPREQLTVTSLPNIHMCTQSTLFSPSSGLDVHSWENEVSLKIPQKSYSTSPHAFSRLQDTIEEEN